MLGSATLGYVIHKESGNFCDYFESKPNAYQNKETIEAAKARAELAALFGDNVADDNDQEESLQSKEEAARAELEKLFGGH